VLSPGCFTLVNGTFKPHFPLAEAQEDPAHHLALGSVQMEKVPSDFLWSGESEHLLQQELPSKSLILGAGIALGGTLPIPWRKSLLRPARLLSSQITSRQQGKVNPPTSLPRDLSFQRTATRKQPGKVGSPMLSPGLTGSAGLTRSIRCLTLMPVLSWDRAHRLFAQLGMAPAPHFATLLPGVPKPAQRSWGWASSAGA